MSDLPEHVRGRESEHLDGDLDGEDGGEADVCGVEQDLVPAVLEAAVLRAEQHHIREDQPLPRRGGQGSGGVRWHQVELRGVSWSSLVCVGVSWHALA